MSIKRIMLEYYNIPAPDSNTSGGVGTLKPKGLGSTFSYAKTYPYVEDLEDITDEEEQEIYDDVFSSDISNVDKLIRKYNPDVMSTDPGGVGVGKRYDMQGMAVNQRLGLAESIAHMKGDKMHGSMSPIPFRSLYRKFSGPAIGGFSTASSYTTGPYGPSGMRTGTKHGFSRAPLGDEDDGIRIRSISDLIDPGERSVRKAKRSVRQAKLKN